MAEVTSQQTRLRVAGTLPSASGTEQPNNSCTLAFPATACLSRQRIIRATVFDRLFGEATGGVAAQRVALNKRRSVLMLFPGRSEFLAHELGSEDRTKLDDTCIPFASGAAQPSGRLLARTCQSPKVDATPFNGTSRKPSRRILSHRCMTSSSSPCAPI